MKTLPLVAAAAFLLTGAAVADTVEVRMTNRGERGAMMFEPE